MSEENPPIVDDIPAAPEVHDPHPDLPGTPDMPYHHRVGLQNLQRGKQDAPLFSSENQPENKGRKPGVKTRATILKAYLELKLREKGASVKNPLTEDGEMTIEEAIEVKLIAKALKGDLRAIQEIKDTVYGKIPEKKAITDGEGNDVPFTVQIIDDIPQA